MHDEPTLPVELMQNCRLARKVLSSRLEHICQEYVQEDLPGEAFLLYSKELSNRLLVVSREFLDLGESLPWPGMPLLGATFNASWGFSAVTVNPLGGLSMGFDLPALDFHELEVGDVHGYRVCMLDESEVPATLSELSKIRSELQNGQLVLDHPSGLELNISALRV